MTSQSISVCVFIVCIGFTLSAAELTCGPNEVVADCPQNCSYNYCPKDEHQDKLPCPKPKICPPPACECGFNYRRAENGTCIPTEQCPPFECAGPNEIFNACPSYCPGDDCRNSNPTGECPFLSLLVINCSPSCTCKPNYWRKDGVCVPYLECPGVRELLKETENGKQQLSVENFYLR